MNDFEMPVAEIDGIAVGQQALGRGGLYPVAGCFPVLGQAVEHLVGGVAISQCPVVAGVCENFRLSLVHAAIGKFMVAADVIEMGVEIEK